MCKCDEIEDGIEGFAVTRATCDGSSVDARRTMHARVEHASDDARALADESTICMPLNYNVPSITDRRWG